VPQSPGLSPGSTRPVMAARVGFQEIKTIHDSCNPESPKADPDYRRDEPTANCAHDSDDRNENTDQTGQQRAIPKRPGPTNIRHAETSIPPYRQIPFDSKHRGRNQAAVVTSGRRLKVAIR
jgi:hypothetical protein